MTAGKLIKLLSKCNPRSKVVIFKETFRHTLQEVAMFDLEKIEEESILQSDDDGGTAVNKDGSERYKTCVVMKGAYPPKTVDEILHAMETAVR